MIADKQELPVRGHLLHPRGMDLDTEQFKHNDRGTVKKKAIKRTVVGVVLLRVYRKAAHGKEAYIQQHGTQKTQKKF